MADIRYTHPALEVLEGKLTVTVEEAATLLRVGVEHLQALGLGRSAAYEATRRGQIPSRRLGRRIVIPVPLLLEWLGVVASAAA